MFEIKPFIPVKFVDTFSLYSGSYFSRELGTLIDGVEKSFRFPFPETLTVACKDSDAFSSVLFVFNLISNFPTAPLKLSGEFNGNTLTLIDLLPAVTFLDT